MLFMVVGVVGVVSAFAGYFSGLRYLIWVGGGLCLFSDFVGFAVRTKTGEMGGGLHPLLPMICYVVGFAVGGWQGILWGSVAVNLVGSVGGLVVMVALLSKRDR
jgi:hypothetical protein